MGLRFQNEKYYIRKYGSNWRNTLSWPGWNYEMDKFLGKPINERDIVWNISDRETYFEIDDWKFTKEMIVKDNPYRVFISKYF